MLEAAVAAGVAAAGGEALLGGVLPTPGAPLLIGRYGLDLGRRHLRLAQPVPRQRRQVLRRRRLQALRRDRGGDRGGARRAAADHAEDRLRPPPPRRARGLPARAPPALRGARPVRPPDPARLRARRHLPRRPGDLPPPRRRGRRAGRRAGRPQHQRQLRLDPRRAARRHDDQGRARRRVRVRRRRRPRAGRRPRRRGRRRRRADRARRAAPARRRPAPGQRGGGDGDDQLRLPHRDALRGRRRGHDAGRRPLRARGAARARLGAGRRAVRPHHRHGLRAVRRRHRRRAAHARVAGGRRPGRAPRHGEAAAEARQRPHGRPRRARRRDGRRPRGDRVARRRASRAAAACSCGPAAPSRSCG